MLAQIISGCTYSGSLLWNVSKNLQMCIEPPKFVPFFNSNRCMHERRAEEVLNRRPRRTHELHIFEWRAAKSCMKWSSNADVHHIIIFNKQFACGAVTLLITKEPSPGFAAGKKGNGKSQAMAKSSLHHILSFLISFAFCELLQSCRPHI